MKPFILGSSSPRRAEYLQLLGFHFHQVRVDYDEAIEPGEPNELVRGLVRSKIQQLRDALHKDASLLPAGLAADELGPLLVADTLVVLDGDPLGKPQDPEEARNMLRRLSGTAHQVLTGVCLGDFANEEIQVVETQVQFRELLEHEIGMYVATGEPMDKAGAYGLQGIGGSFVLEVQGSVSGVVGLPLAQTQALLSRWGQPHLLSEAR